MNYSALQQLGLNTEKALKLLMQRDELYARVLRRFVDERADISQQLQNRLALSDYENAGLLVHSLKSLAATLGADRLHEICIELEAQLFEHTCEAQLCRQFDAEIQRLIIGLKPILAAGTQP